MDRKLAANCKEPHNLAATCPIGQSIQLLLFQYNFVFFFLKKFRMLNMQYNLGALHDHDVLLMLIKYHMNQNGQKANRQLFCYERGGGLPWDTHSSPLQLQYLKYMHGRMNKKKKKKLLAKNEKSEIIRDRCA